MVLSESPVFQELPGRKEQKKTSTNTSLVHKDAPLVTKEQMSPDYHQAKSKNVPSHSVLNIKKAESL